MLTRGSSFGGLVHLTAAASRTGPPAWSSASGNATSTRGTSSPTCPPTSPASSPIPSTSSGVAWKQANRQNISIARKEAVALMDTHVGPRALTRAM